MAGSFLDIAASIRPSYGTADNVVDGFYVPLLARSKSYDRVAGYFTSWGLAIAARGLAEFVAGGGTVRLIVGAQLAAEDVAAVEDGADLAAVVADRLASGELWADTDEVCAHRLHVLAWLAKEDRLSIKVGVPRRPDGSLIPATETTDYFHDKFGVFTDHDGHQVAFIGSNNDSRHGWLSNSESFSVTPDWEEGAWAWNGQNLVDRFERYWMDEHSPEWKIVPLSRAVRDGLLRTAHFEGPPSSVDPESKVGQQDPVALATSSADESALKELFDVPRRSPFTAVMSAGVEPLPHQRAVIDRAVRTYPRGYLFGDEVGLGKTIEVGLTVRELLLTGKASRVLLLVPAAVLTQWQEELFEKVALWVPRWGEGRWVWPDGSETFGKAGDPWASKERVILASSHLARRSDQRPKIVAASPWDVVVIDEAHHARRKGGKAAGTPNTLLSLLQDLHEHEGWHALYMASATPMQMYPHEAWDLIELFDLPGWWAESADKFEHYFTEVGIDWPRRQWNFVARMVNDHFSDPSTEPNAHLDAEILTNVKGADRVALISGAGPKSRVVIAEKLCKKVGAEIKANKQWYEPVGKKPELASTVTAWLYTNNPMRDRVFRNTRGTLRAYRDAGVWPAGATIPDRVVDDIPVRMSTHEQGLYCEVQDYIRTKYDQAEQIASGRAKNALGFILTVYRRRLTSSFYAIEQSLRRRIEALDGNLGLAALLSADDTILEDEPDIAADVATWALDDEIVSLRKLADKITIVANTDESKMVRLHQVVSDALNGGHQTVLVFTQYADTMHYVRDRLDAIWHGRVIGYSSDGGTIRDQTTGEWVKLTKRQTKEMFRAGDTVKVLVGTDTLAEGLNLQTCGRLVNYDLPWNFTRVEQRIGRVDRIGGHDRVEVTNLLYEGTVESAVYQKLVHTFGGFNAVVGIAQPVLGKIEAVIKEASLTDMCDDHDAPTGTVDANLFDDGSHRLGLDDAVAKVIAAANDAGARTLAELDEHGSPVAGTIWTPAMTLAELRDALLAIPSVAARLMPTEIEGVFRLDVGSTALVTFDREVLDRLAPDVRLLTWGSPLLDKLNGWVALGAIRSRPQSDH